MDARAAWINERERRHEARLKIIHAGSTNEAVNEWEERQRRVDEEEPSTPTHRIHYAPTFVVEIDIAPYEDADKIISQMINGWNDSLPEAGDSWETGYLDDEDRYADTSDLEVTNTGSTSSWEPISGPERAHV